MKAMIFAAGLGTRLRPITDNKPKALVEVGGEPALHRVLRNLHDAGVDEIVVNVHHYPNQVIDYLNANTPEGVRVDISDESDCLLDTGGGLLAARHYLDGEESFFLHNADIATDIDLSAMMHEHLRSGADVTLLVAPRESSRQLLFDEGGRMRGWTNIKTGEVRPADIDSEQFQMLAFGGIHVVSPKLFPLLEAYSSERIFSIVPFYVANCSELNIRAYVPQQPYRWFDIGKLDSLRRADNEFNNSNNK